MFQNICIKKAHEPTLEGAIRGLKQQMKNCSQ